LAIQANLQTRIVTPPRCNILQRKCACGGTPGPTGECEQCRRKRLALQHKLTINQPGDRYEQEADRVAEAVVSGADSAGNSITPLAATKEEPKKSEEESLQRAGGDHEISAAPPIVDEVLQSSGQPLDAATRAFMEQRIGHDFSQVRVHFGGMAEQSAREVNAHAYTVGYEIVFGTGRFAPKMPEGRRLIAHELAHVVQQSALGRTHARGNRGPQGMVGYPSVRGLLQRQESTAPVPTRELVGDAVKSEVERLLKEFASASDNEGKNAAAVQAVNAIIRAYRMSTKGLEKIRFLPVLEGEDKGADAETVQREGNVSDINFGPGAFNQGFETLVHLVAHELEHVRQNLVGPYSEEEVSKQRTKKEPQPVAEFLAYNGSVLQVQSTRGPARKGFLGGLITETRQRTPSPPSLPPLPPDKLAYAAEMALNAFAKIPREQMKPQYRQELAGARDKLFERLRKEAPRPLQPPKEFTPEWSRWYEGQAPTDDTFTIEYQDWQESLKSPWARVKAIWKQFDAVFRGRRGLP
jgi:Domain of unknown function (DUF4157)